MSIINENSIRVHQMNTKKIIDELEPKMRKARIIKENQSLKLSEDAVIKVKNGFFLVNTDCCWGYSETKIQLINGLPKKFEAFTLMFEVVTDNGGGNTSHQMNAFEYSIECGFLLKDYCFPVDKTLKEFMGSRFGYNPRIIKNVKDLIKDCKTYHYGEN